MKHVVSLSGGRTSTGVLPTEVIKKYGKENVDLIFCDTGAEHPDTYRFVRDSEKELGVKVTCLKLVMPKDVGIGASYNVCSTSEIKQDYYAWMQLTSKYGNPYMPGGKFCTDQMKTIIFKKYCTDTYGKGDFYTWLGYRYEEGNRIWGKVASGILGKLGMNNIEKTEFYLSCLESNVDGILNEYYPSMFPNPEDDAEKLLIKKALKTISDKNYRFMPELCKFDKGDVIAWWSNKDTDLNIEEHETNCVFCIEKPHAVIMLAIKDNLEMAKEFLNVVESSSVANKPNRKEESNVMYRDGVTFRWLYEKAINTPREEILYMSRMGQRLAKKNTCSSGECSPFGVIHEEQEEMGF